MSAETTVLEAAQKALLLIGRPASVDEIYQIIVNNSFYTFNTPTPEHVLRTTIRRHTKDVERVDSSDAVLFEVTDNENYRMVTMSKPIQKKTSTIGMKRIHRAADKEEIIKALTSEQVGVFREIWKLLLFAAQVGVSNNRREPLLSVDTGKGIDQGTFGNSPSWPGIAFLMSLVETEKSESLSGTSDAEDNRIVVFQEYANGGLSVLQEFFKERSIDLDGLLSFIESQSAKVIDKPDLELTI
jgi:dnd system-associated protein 4